MISQGMQGFITNGEKKILNGVGWMTGQISKRKLNMLQKMRQDGKIEVYVAWIQDFYIQDLISH